MFQFYNPNPAGRISVGDCAVRALTKVLNVEKEKIIRQLEVTGEADPLRFFDSEEWNKKVINRIIDMQ